MLKFLFNRYNKNNKNMLSDELINYEPREEYKQLDNDCVFIGVKIKNLYDEERTCIQEDFLPSRYKSINNTNLFGIVKDILPEHKQLIEKIKSQKIFDLIGYNLLLQDYKLTCNECYFNLRPPIYPIDNHFINKYIPEFNFEKFICFKPEIPKFQTFASLNLFFIVHA